MTKAFLFGAIVMPILMMALFILVVPLMMESNNTPLQGTIVVVAPDDVALELEKQIAQGGTVADEVLEQLPKALQNDSVTSTLLGSTSSTDLSVFIAQHDDLDILKNEVRSGTYAGLIVVPESIVQSDESDELLEVFIPSSFSPNHTDILTLATSPLDPAKVR